MEKFVTVVKALSDANRIRALLALKTDELCVCQIIELLGLAPSTVSKHMSILKLAGLVKSRKEERWIYYRLPDHTQDGAMIQKTLDWVFQSLEKDDMVSEDSKRLGEIVKQNPLILCKKRREKFSRLRK